MDKSEKMAKNLCSLILIFLFFSACQLSETESTFTPTLEPLLASTPTSTQETIPSTSVALNTTITLSPRITSVHPTAKLEPSPTAVSTPIVQPVIHESPGDIYETMYSIPVGDNKIIRYEIPSCCANIQGPSAIAVLLDDSYLISDPIADRLIHYDQVGRLLGTIELNKLGIGSAVDLRVKGSELFLLDKSYQKFRVHHLSLDGILIASDEIPYNLPIDPNEKDFTFEGGLTGIVIDCEGNVILEIAGGSKLFPLSEVHPQTDLTRITQGIFCNGKRFLVTTPGLFQDPQINVGDITYKTQVTNKLGGLHFLYVRQDGSFYVVRSDVVTDQMITVDETVHYVGTDGSILGVARVPLSEFYCPIDHNLAVSPSGEVFSLLPRPDSIDIIRLNFYKHLAPLIPGAAVPQITISLNNP